MMQKTPMLRFLCGLLLFGTVAAVASAYSLTPEPRVPLDRLLRNAERHLRENRSDADAHYAVARLNYLLFAGETAATPLAEKAPESDVWSRRPMTADRSAATAAMELVARRAEIAFIELSAACKLRPQNAHFRLGRASVADEFLTWSRRVGLKHVPPDLQHVGDREVRLMYLEAFRLALADDKARAGPRPALGGLASYEAGLRWQELVHAAGGGELEETRAEVAAGMALLREWPHGELLVLQTPMVLSLQEGVTLGQLLRPEARVTFDLRGYGVKSVWSWVSGEAGLLVWDPERGADITSARQLFGGYTFQIARATGYAALAALDDDGDGFLRGAELAGIRVWFDRNGDGRSSMDEVLDLGGLGIVALAVHATGSEGIHPMNPAGVIFADGRMLPTWDWLVAPHRE